MKRILLILSSVCCVCASLAQGNRLFSGGEAAVFGTLDLATPSGQTWSTERASLPGYFSVVNSAAITGASDATNINGYVKKYGNQSFTFPVGDGTDLRTLTMSAPSAGTDAYATAWIPGDPTTTLDPTGPNGGYHSIYSFSPPIDLVSPAGQWDWQVGNGGNLGPGTTGTGAGLTITVSIPDMNLFGSPPTLRLVGWNGTSWIDLSGGPTATGSFENNFLTGTMVAGISAIAIGKRVTILPLNLESFTATPFDCNAKLIWKTLNEVNTDKFVVEQSKDGTTFLPVGSVTAAGNAATHAYDLTVAQTAEKNFYRLKMMDKNGSFTYSPIVTCVTRCASADNIVVYPNPVIANGIIFTSFVTQYRGKATFSMTGVNGQRIMDKVIEVHEGPNLIPAEVDRLATGTYFITITTDKGKLIGTVQRFVKQ